MAESQQVEKVNTARVSSDRAPASEAPARDGLIAGAAARSYQRASLDPRGLSPSAFLALQRTAGNKAVNGLLRGFAERQARAVSAVPVQRDPPAGGGGTAAPEASPPGQAGDAPAAGGSAQQAQLQLPPPAPEQVPTDQIAAADSSAVPAGAPPTGQPGGGAAGDAGSQGSAGGGGGGQGGAAGGAGPDAGEVDLVRTTTNARTGEHTIDFTASFHVPAFHLPSFQVLGREVQPFDDQSVFIQMSFDPGGGGAVPGSSISYSQIHSTLVGVSTSALNAHVFLLHGREFFDLALPVSLGVQNDATGASANAQAGIQAAVNATREISITATVNGQANIPLGGGPATFSFAGVSIGVAGKF